MVSKRYKTGQLFPLSLFEKCFLTEPTIFKKGGGDYGMYNTRCQYSDYIDRHYHILHNKKITAPVF